MTKFNFSHFPDESELSEDINYAFRIQCDHGALDTIKESIIQARNSPEYMQEDWQIDCIGYGLLNSISEKSVSVSDLSEEEKEALAILWVNYMCDKPRGEIVQSVGIMMEKGENLKTHSINIVQEQIKQDLNDESTQLGAVMYLWTLICVIRAVSKSINAGLPKTDNIAPPAFKGNSLN